MLSQDKMVAKFVLEKYFYTDLCDIYNKGSVTDSETHLTSQKKVMICENEPCRVSFNNSTTVIEDNAPTSKQSIKLFLKPNLSVKAGSSIKVSRNGKTLLYKASTKPSVYDTHQEIELESVTRG